MSKGIRKGARGNIRVKYKGRIKTQKTRGKKISTRDIRQKHSERPVNERIIDEQSTDILTNNEELWLSNPRKYDFRDVDTALPDGYKIVKNVASRDKDPYFMVLEKLPQNTAEAREFRKYLDKFVNKYSLLNTDDGYDSFTEIERDRLYDKAEEVFDRNNDSKYSDLLGTEHMRNIYKKTENLNFNYPEAGYLYIQNARRIRKDTPALYLHHLWIHKDMRNKKLSPYLMRELLNYADENKIDLALSAQPFERELLTGMREHEQKLAKMSTIENVNKLVEFYKQYGFETEGKMFNKYGMGIYSQGMIRKHQ